MATQRDYQPSLIWALVQGWIERQEDRSSSYPPIKGPRQELHIYRSDKPGCYLMHGPKLYWKDEAGGQYFTNCDEEDLWENHELLSEVSLHRWPDQHSVKLLGRTWVEFLSTVKGSV